MNKFVKGVGIGVLVLVILVVVGISATIGWRPFIGSKKRALTDRRFEATPERLKRGEYLSEHVAGCTYCHTPQEQGPNGPELVRGQKGGGQFFSMPGFPGTVVAPNITPDPETGIGNFTDDQLARAIREGISHDGQTLFPMMPYTHFRQMSDEDLASVVVYLKTLPPIRNALPRTEIHFPVKYLIRGVPEPVTGTVQADLSTPASRGEYLVNLSSCLDCHTPRKRGRLDSSMKFAGGQVFDASGQIASPNITPDVTGIGSYTEEKFVKALRTGYVGKRQLNTVMPWQGYSGQTDEDLKAMYGYLRTVPAVAHHVDNTQPPTACKKCGQKHGAGDTN
ncbi:MAG TPA: cytochrome c [Verrucomicrobiae bacterium]|jgi:mono/diheme cytochrome c family protein|nr:cytochrome c [Verrucomicrobiae bacterium]